MGEKIGKLVVCDRCGEITFCKTVKRKDGVGNDYESTPNGWMHYLAIGHLCPACNAEYTEFLKGFMQREKK